MLVSFERMKRDLFLGMNRLDIFAEISYFLLESLSLSLQLFDFLLNVNCRVLQFYRVTLLLRNIFFQIIAAVFQMQQMMWQVFALIVLKVRSL